MEPAKQKKYVQMRKIVPTEYRLVDGVDPSSRKVGKGKRGTGRVVAAKDGSWLTYGAYEYLLRSTDVSSNQTEPGSFCKPAGYLMYFCLSSFALLGLYELSLFMDSI